MKVLAIVALLAVMASAHSQRSTLPSSTPINFKPLNLRIFSDTEREMVFSLSVSWIPGSSRTGVMRYRIRGVPGTLSTEERRMVMNEAVDTERFAMRVAACNLTAVLYDGDDFILRNIPRINFTEGLDVLTGKIISLSANDSIDLPATDYRSIGSWNIEWNCPPVPTP